MWSPNRVVVEGLEMTMKITTLVKTAVASVSTTTIAIAGAPITSAADYPVNGKLGRD
jgi:hypothetical protein